MIYGYRIIKKIRSDGKKNSAFSYIENCLFPVSYRWDKVADSYQWGGNFLKTTLEFYYYDDDNFRIFKIAFPDWDYIPKRFYSLKAKVSWERNNTFKLDFVEEDGKIKMLNGINKKVAKEIINSDDWKIGNHPLVEVEI